MLNLFNVTIFLLSTIALQCLLTFWVLRRQRKHQIQADLHHEKLQQALTTQLHQLHMQGQQAYQIGQHSIHEKITQGHLSSQQLIADTVQRQMNDVREQINHSFQQHATSLTAHLQSLTEEIRNHLQSFL